MNANYVCQKVYVSSLLLSLHAVTYDLILSVLSTNYDLNVFRRLPVVSDPHFLQKSNHFYTGYILLHSIFEMKSDCCICNTEKIGQCILQVYDEVSFTK